MAIVKVACVHSRSKPSCFLPEAHPKQGREDLVSQGGQKPELGQGTEPREMGRGWSLLLDSCGNTSEMGPKWNTKGSENRTT